MQIRDCNAWKCEYVKFKNYERKIKSPFTIYAYFESTLVQEDSRKKNPKESKAYCLQLWLYLVCVDDKFSKPFKAYLGEDVV